MLIESAGVMILNVIIISFWILLYLQKLKYDVSNLHFINGFG